MKITKTFSWIMGHRLTFHKDGCATPHGHNFKCDITLDGNLDKNGMLIDFHIFKKIFEDKVFISFHPFTSF